MTAVVSPTGTAIVKPHGNSRLAQLLGMYDAAKAEADAAAKALKTITDGIKAELTTAAPGATSIDIESGLTARPLRLIAVTSWRVDAGKLKTDDPETYVRYAKQSTAWTLKPVSG